MKPLRALFNTVLRGAGVDLLIEARSQGVFKISRLGAGDPEPLITLTPGAQALPAFGPIASVTLALPEDRGVQDTVSLPLGAKAALRDTLAADMDRLTPFAAEDVYFGFAAGKTNHAAKTLAVDLALVPRTDADAALDGVRALGLEPDTMTLGTGGLALDFPRRGHAGHRAPNPRMRQVIRIVMIAVLAAAALAAFEMLRRDFADWQLLLHAPGVDAGARFSDTP